MSKQQPWKRELLEEGGRFLAHTAAIVLGVVLMFVGLGMGVSLVLLPLGLPVGLGGVLLLLWGLFGYPENKHA